MWPGTFAPTPAHRFFRLLHEHKKLKRCFTQNIDSLEAAAGLPREMVVAAHGNFDAAHVVGTGEAVDIDELKAAILEGEESVRALCEREGGLVKPAITFFGEALPARFGECARADFADCRLLLIFGTSLKVQPFASLVQRCPPATPRMLINRERVGEDAGLDFDREGSSDGAFLGDCDVGAQSLAELLGWDLSVYAAPRTDLARADPDADAAADVDDHLARRLESMELASISSNRWTSAAEAHSEGAADAHDQAVRQHVYERLLEGGMAPAEARSFADSMPQQLIDMQDHPSFSAGRQ